VYTKLIGEGVERGCRDDRVLTRAFTSQDLFAPSYTRFLVRTDDATTGSWRTRSRLSAAARSRSRTPHRRV
jgi:hypothetical protein